MIRQTIIRVGMHKPGMWACTMQTLGAFLICMETSGSGVWTGMSPLIMLRKLIRLAPPRVQIGLPEVGRWLTMEQISVPRVEITGFLMGGTRPMVFE